MVVGVDGEVSGDKWAVRELNTITRSQTAISDDRRPRRLFVSANFQSLGNTRRPIVDALCSSTPLLVNAIVSIQQRIIVHYEINSNKKTNDARSQKVMA